MVAFRVELTQQQKRNRGQLIVRYLLRIFPRRKVIIIIAAVYESSSGQV